ncbi:ribosomal protein L1/ribosomal biogenesis protein [Phycomyces blakesleeanus]|uniref:Ribosomal protein L1 n=2 Tax=Phycomyces blakesleeanus TaxID=4837 RepID=A0A163B4Y4_PHYB8|nr:hypothetical protein PHYBLDRAFT_157511 [Phycomyces blakesleeanus NRRL 1555(-)]OAD78281.1 hypothetical protein PHYBLDRAFT_157511 [Phycomyces blakesleeanus NRRL 1555(-)]|eukprot:XP_018296321.1 hypothetical protein PHYBLDRAFT_157511 [Phycomyces blakesleeanus NRRL 1555(-)]
MKTSSSTLYDKDQVKKATHALWETYNDPEKPAFNPSQELWLNMTIKEASPQRSSKPKKISLKHAILNEKDKVCLITKECETRYNKLLKNEKSGYIEKIIGINTLETSYKSPESRCELASMLSIFFVDIRVVGQMKKVLGESFFGPNRAPIPIEIPRPKKINSTIIKHLKISSIMLSNGVTQSAKVGSLRMDEREAFDNVCSAIPGFVNIIKGGWENIMSITLKTDKSPELPLFISIPDKYVGGEDKNKT